MSGDFRGDFLQSKNLRQELEAGGGRWNRGFLQQNPAAENCPKLQTNQSVKTSCLLVEKDAFESF
jgi:hypothetical protein